MLDPAEGLPAVRSQLWEQWMSIGVPGIHLAPEVITNAVEEASRVVEQDLVSWLKAFRNSGFRNTNSIQ